MTVDEIVVDEADGIVTIIGIGILAGSALVWLPLAAALVAVASLIRAKKRAFVVSVSAVVVSVIAGAVLLLFPVLNETKSLRTLSEQASAAQIRTRARSACCRSSRTTSTTSAT